MWYRRAQNISPIYIRLLNEEDAEDIYAIYANQNVTDTPIGLDYTLVMA